MLGISLFAGEEPGVLPKRYRGRLVGLPEQHRQKTVERIPMVSRLPIVPSRTAAPSTYVLVFDGGCEPNPGHGYGSYCVTDTDGRRYVHRVDFGDDCTCNTAEYKALIYGLEAILGQIEDDGRSSATCSVDIYGDSRLVVRQVKGLYACHSPVLKPLSKEAKKLLKQFGHYSLTWHPRENSVALLGH